MATPDCIFGLSIPDTVGSCNQLGGNILERRFHRQWIPIELQPRASPRISLGDERGSEIESGPRVVLFTQRALPPLCHREFNFRYRQLDAGNGAGLGDGDAYQQSDLAGNGESCGRFADVVADDGWWRGSGQIRQA